ncbi:MAG: hypothetical protein ABI273_12450 [Lacunisphaera sp.]
MPRREIILLGERDLSKRAHLGIEASIEIFRRQVDPTIAFQWVATSEIASRGPERALGSATGIWCVPGSPYESTDGPLQAIRYAREQRRAFLGTCGGFQHALMEYCRNVLGREAVHQEVATGATAPLIVKLTCSLVGANARVIAVPGSSFAELLESGESIEEFNCNYGLATALESIFVGSDLKFTAYDEAKQVRAFQLERHPFFVGTLFQPERRALTDVLHPVVRAFLQQA